MKKKIGIVCDNYKVQLFENELKKHGIEIIVKEPFIKGCTSIICFSTEEKVKAVTEEVTRQLRDKYEREN